jgi:hypothetical protein
LSKESCKRNQGIRKERKLWQPTQIGYLLGLSKESCKRNQRMKERKNFVATNPDWLFIRVE